jgi:mediator of RNA polymerase II transcription subunit 18
MFQQEQASEIRLDSNSCDNNDFQAEPKTEQPVPAHPETLWQVEVKTISPVYISKETPLEQYIEAVLEVQTLMRGLLDIRRQDQ